MRFRLKLVFQLIFLLGFCVFGFYLMLFNNNEQRIHDPVTRTGRSVLEYRVARYQSAQDRPVKEGPGENGRPVKLTPEQKEIADKLFKNASFNVYASDMVAMDRSIPDTRRKECKPLQYPSVLPTISVILVFNNEALSAVLRTVHSVVNRTPPQYLHEVILLDDCSDHEELKEHLDNVVSETWPDGIVKVVRRESRGGLVKARVSGARAASGDVLVIMDAHMEVNVQWAEPILYHLQENPNHLVVPVIDNIQDTDLQYMGSTDMFIQGFTWTMYYTWLTAPKRLQAEQRNMTEPLKTFAMVGCVFAINREYFFHIGAFDEGMGIWGGENVELPLRVWMCGGAVYQLPCSRVGHLYRKTHPFTFPEKGIVELNTKRTAEVWLDEYKRLYYLGKPAEAQTRDVGDLSERIALRKRLNCHSFKWFLQNIYLEKFVMDEGVLAYGVVRNAETGLCLDSLDGKLVKSYTLGLNKCFAPFWKVRQQMSLSRVNQFRMEHKCFTRRSRVANDIEANTCSGGTDQNWYYNKKDGTMRHDRSGLCMDGGESKVRGKPLLKPCDGSPRQKWTWGKLFY